MTDFQLLQSPPYGLPEAGRHGVADGPAGVTARIGHSGSICLIQGRKGQGDVLAAAAKILFQVDLPGPGRIAHTRNGMIAWCGPENWLVISDGAGDQAGPLGQTLQGAASVVDLSDGRTVLKLSGPKVRQTLEKGVTIDLHPDAFRLGDTAVTLLAHSAVQISLIDAGPTFQIIMARTSAADVCYWLKVSAAEFGLDLIS